VAAVLLYRILSFWGELPVGWAAWGILVWMDRRTDASSAQTPVDDRVESAELSR
jgi:hypothetical protein